MKINGEAIQQIKTLNANPPSDKKHEIPALKRVMDNRHVALDKFLSPNQIKQITETEKVDAATLMTDAIAVDLNLTDAQMASLDKVNLTYLQSMLGTMKEGKKRKAKQREKDTLSGRDNGMKQVLTPDQWTKYKNLSQPKK
jgi:hypothetical protein